MKISVFFFIIFLLAGCSHSKTHTYLATPSSACGSTVLILEVDDKTMKAVSIVGNIDPTTELNHFVLSNTTLEVKGHFSGKYNNRQHCSDEPEFVITEYQAAGPVSRCTTYSDIYTNEILILFPEALTKNKLAPVDYRKNYNLLVKTSKDNCRKVSQDTQCRSNETSANSCDLNEFYCCSYKDIE